MGLYDGLGLPDPARTRRSKPRQYRDNTVRDKLLSSCKPYDKATDSGGFCFGSLLCKVLGEPYDDECLPCFRAAGYQPTVSNDRQAGTNP